VRKAKSERIHAESYSPTRIREILITFCDQNTPLGLAPSKIAPQSFFNSSRALAVRWGSGSRSQDGEFLSIPQSPEDLLLLLQ
jgi:hypothetical protein